METIGAPHSSTAARHSSSGSVLLDGGLVLADAAAAGAGQVAGVQRLQHQHHREPLVDHRMRLAAWRVAGLAMAGCGTDWTHPAPRRSVLLPLRPRPHLVLENVSGHAGRHRERKSHSRIRSTPSGLHDTTPAPAAGSRAGTGGTSGRRPSGSRCRWPALRPSCRRPLRLEQVLDAVLHAAAVGIAAGDQAQHRPGGLRRRARRRR